MPKDKIKPTPIQRRVAELRRERASINSKIEWLYLRDEELFKELMRIVAKK